MHYPTGSIRRWVYMVAIKEKQCSGRPWHLNDAQLAIRDLNCAKKTSPALLHHHHQPAVW